MQKQDKNPTQHKHKNQIRKQLDQTLLRTRFSLE